MRAPLKTAAATWAPSLNIIIIIIIKESDKSKVRKGRRQKRRLKERLREWLWVRLVCCSGLFVPGEVFEDKERTEL